MNLTAQLPECRLFTHEAMRTTFSLRLAGMAAGEAAGVARECFELVDLLESRLSRFREGSDVWRINRMEAGETLYLSDACHRCLLLALDAHARSGGLFDAALGAAIEHRKEGRPGPPPPPAGRLVIHPDVPAVTCAEPGRQLDLGGIGKGFALDEVHGLLADWGAGSALLGAGASTLLAIGGDTWPVELAGGHDTRRIGLAGRALSASGTGVQGEHVVDPRGEGEPGAGWRRVWLVAASAGLADALSTAALLMDAGELARFAAGDEAVEAVFADAGGAIEQVAGGTAAAGGGC